MVSVFELNVLGIRIADITQIVMLIHFDQKTVTELTVNHLVSHLVIH